jgi:hypothetical protein
MTKRDKQRTDVHNATQRIIILFRITQSVFLREIRVLTITVVATEHSMLAGQQQMHHPHSCRKRMPSAIEPLSFLQAFTVRK